MGEGVCGYVRLGNDIASQKNIVGHLGFRVQSAILAAWAASILPGMASTAAQMYLLYYYWTACTIVQYCHTTYPITVHADDGMPVRYR